ncbi:MAG: Fe-S-containing hydro-lyase [Saccharofermentanales bacterium]
MRKTIMLPLTKEKRKDLRAGDKLLLTGYLFTARDAAHKKIYDMLLNGEDLPVALKDETVYYSGPCPASPGHPIGSAGPTTSGRMDKYAPLLIAKGLTCMIGKGDRDQATIEAIQEYGAVYLGATGGAGALIARCVRSCEVVAFPELGTEAIRRLYVEDFPAVVLIDSEGNNLYRISIGKYRIE